MADGIVKRALAFSLSNLAAALVAELNVPSVPVGPIPSTAFLVRPKGTSSGTGNSYFVAQGASERAPSANKSPKLSRTAMDNNGRSQFEGHNEGFLICRSVLQSKHPRVLGCPWQ